MTDSFQKFKKKTCRYSGKILPEPFLDLGLSPLANSLVAKGKAHEPEFFCPLQLTRCPESGLVQLAHVVPPDLLFSHYLYVSSTTKTFQDHFAAYAEEVSLDVRKREEALAVDIGSNDGLLLAAYQRHGLRAVGVDPAKNLAEEANRNGRETINRYFDAQAVRGIIARYGQADAVSANNVFAHIDDVHAVCRNVKDLLRPDGLFVIEFPYLRVMLDQLLFDMIYHEHLSYIAVHSLQYLFRQYGLEIFKIRSVDSHGGSLRVFAQRAGGSRKISPEVGQYLQQEKEAGLLTEQPYREFSRRVMKVKTDLNAAVRKIKEQGKTIAGYGAPAKATTIVNFCGLTSHQIDFVVDDNPLKQGYLMPGAKIPIVSSQYLQSHPADYVLIFAWNFAKEIVVKNRYLTERGSRFLIPLPELSVVDENGFVHPGLSSALLAR